MYNRIEVFYAYAPEDETWVRELEKHLSSLQRQGIISTWHPRLIAAGEDWQHVIDDHFQKASVILLLISPDFVASDYCYGNEMKQALQREREKGVCVIPILLRPVDWRYAPFTHLRPLPSDATFLTEWPNLDRAFAEISSGIRQAIENLPTLAASLARSDFPGIWNVPFPRNLFFIGREDLLTTLHAQLQRGRSAALTQAIWSLSFTRVAERNPAATDLLRLCAFLAPDTIREDMLMQGADVLPSPLASVVADGYLLDQAIEALRAYSLIIRDTQARALSVHRLVQTVIRDAFSTEERQQWMQSAVALVNQAFPEVEFATWPQCEQCLPHALLCAQWITQGQITTPQATRLLDHLGYYLTVRGQYAEAEPPLQQALAIRQQQLGPEHLDTATSLHHLALLYRHRGKYVGAEQLYQRALAIREQKLGSEHPDTATNLHDLAALYQLQAKYAESEQLYQRALIIREQRLGFEHPGIVNNLSDLASLYENWGKYAQAEPLLLRSLSICERQLGPEHPDTAYSLHNLALIYQRQGKYAQAEPIALRALAIREQQLGSEHPDIANSLSNLGTLYVKEGRYTEAEPLALRALSIREQQLGIEHPSTAISLGNLISIYIPLGKFNDAEPLAVRALTIREKQLGSEHPLIASSLDELANIYGCQGKYDEAVRLLRKALSICEQRLGTEHPRTGRVLHDLAFWIARQGKYTEAEDLYRQALAIRTQRLGPEHPSVATTLYNLAELHIDQGQYIEAEPLYQRALAIRMQQLGPEHPDALITQERYTSFCSKK